MDLPSRAKWYEYSRARDAMLKATDNKVSPWYIVQVRRQEARASQHHRSTAEADSAQEDRQAEGQAARRARRNMPTTTRRRSRAGGSCLTGLLICGCCCTHVGRRALSRPEHVRRRGCADAAATSDSGHPEGCAAGGGERRAVRRERNPDILQSSDRHPPRARFSVAVQPNV